MNETPILDQLRIYSEALVEDLPNSATDIVNAPAPFAPRPPERSRVWAVAAAAALTLVIVGGIAWLLPNNDSAPPAVEPTPTTTPAEITVPETTIPTDDAVTPTTVASSNTSLAADPVPPPGEGPRLEFGLAESPSDEWLDDGVWFQGSLYALSRGKLFRSIDGFSWELLPGPDPGWVPRGGSWGLETGGGLLVYAGVDQVDGSECALPGDTIVVHTSIDGADWKTSRIDLPIPDSSTTFGCYGIWAGLREGLAVGPQGIMVSAVVQGEIFADSIFEAEFGLGLDPETLEMAIGGGFMEVTTADGEVYEIDLDAAGYLDDIESWLGVATDDPNFAELALNGSWHTGTGYAWFSPDGQTWSQLDASGPLDGGEIAAVVATSGGFVATSSSGGSPSPPGPAQDILWETTDGTTWIEMSTLADSHLAGNPSGLDVWAGRLVAASKNGVWTIEHTPQELIGDTGAARFGVVEIGEFGLVAMHSEVDGGGTEVLFSADGTTWNRWTPPEFGAEGIVVYLVGIGDDFLVLRAITETGVSNWVGRLP